VKPAAQKRHRQDNKSKAEKGWTRPSANLQGVAAKQFAGESINSLHKAAAGWRFGPMVSFYCLSSQDDVRPYLWMRILW